MLDEIREELVRAVDNFAYCDLDSIAEVEGASNVMAVIGFEVFLPSKYKRAGETPEGVRKKESVILKFERSYPYSPPAVYLRKDFNRELPHVNPFPKTGLVSPCIFPGGDNSSLLHTYGGLYGFLYKIKQWLDRAARDGLYDSEIGWEPIISPVENGEAYADVWGAAKKIPANKNSIVRSAIMVIRESGKVLAKVSGFSVSIKSELSEKKEDYSIYNSFCIYMWSNVSSGYSTKRDFSDIGSLDDLKDFLKAMSVVGFLNRDIRKLEKKKSKGDQVHFLVAVCLRRPVTISGESHNIEILLFHVDRRVGERDGLSKVHQIGFLQEATPDFSQKVSGISGVNLGASKVLMIGAGSLGSKVTVSLARMGVGRLDIFDRSSLRAHNQIRYGLTLGWISAASPLGKAWLVSKSCTDLNRKSEAFLKDFIFALSDDPVLADGYDLVVDTTGSPAVFAALCSKFNKSLTRVVSAQIFSHGGAAWILADGVDRECRVDDVRANVFADLPNMDKELSGPVYASSDYEQIEIGQGCMTPTVVLSDSDISLYASFLSDHIVSLLKAPVNEGHAKIIYKNESGVAFKDKYFSSFCEVVCDDGKESWSVRFSEEIKAKLFSDADAYSPLETGGVIYGVPSVSERKLTVVICDEPPRDSIREKNRFILGTEGLQERINEIQRECPGVRFLGTWHSHPEGGGFSSIDFQTLNDKAKDMVGLPFVMMLLSDGEIFVEVKSA